MLILLILAILTIGYILYELKVFNIDYKQLFKPIIENKSNYTNYKEYTEYAEQNIDDDIYFESTISNRDKNTVSDNIQVENSDYNKLNTVSGDISCKQCRVNLINTVSGDINIKGSNITRVNSVSGDIYIANTSNIEKANTVSGNINILESYVNNVNSTSGTITIFKSEVQTLNATIDQLDLKSGHIKHLIIDDYNSSNIYSSNVSITINRMTIVNGKKKRSKELKFKLPYNVYIDKITFNSDKTGKVVLYKGCTDIPVVVNGEII